MKFLIAANIKLKTMGNEQWPNWQTIITGDITKLPTHLWIRPSSLSEHLFLGDGELGCDQAAEADARMEVSNGKQRAQVISDELKVDDQPQDDNDDDDKSMTPKRKGIIKIPSQKSNPAEQVTSAPLRVGPPGPGKIQAVSALDVLMAHAGIGGAGLQKVTATRAGIVGCSNTK